MNEIFNAGSKTLRRRPDRFGLRLGFAICLALLSSVVGLAQGTRGTISGEVTDQNGAAVPGATIKLVNLARKQEVRTATTMKVEHIKSLRLIRQAMKS